jgi:hypothetical protein
MKLSLLIDNEVNDDNKAKLKTLIGMINNTELSLDKLYLRIDNLGYNVYGHKVFEFSHYTNVPIGFSNNNSNIFPIT